jgi:hypothetical protein
MLARILQRELGAKVTICYSLDDEGFIDPNRSDHIPGLEALETAERKKAYMYKHKNFDLKRALAIFDAVKHLPKTK